MRVCSQQLLQRCGEHGAEKRGIANYNTEHGFLGAVSAESSRAKELLALVALGDPSCLGVKMGLEKAHEGGGDGRPVPSHLRPMLSRTSWNTVKP